MKFQVNYRNLRIGSHYTTIVFFRNGNPCQDKDNDSNSKRKSSHYCPEQADHRGVT
jgi:hypothetical protein